MRASLSLPLTPEFLRSVLTSICESSPYTAAWATATSIKRDPEHWVVSMRVDFDREDGDEGDRAGRGSLTFTSVARGISVALCTPDLDSRLRGAILAAAVTNDAGGDFDGVCADVIAQCALLGKVVYG